MDPIRPDALAKVREELFLNRAACFLRMNRPGDAKFECDRILNPSPSNDNDGSDPGPNEDGTEFFGSDGKPTFGRVLHTELSSLPDAGPATQTVESSGCSRLNSAVPRQPSR